MFDHPIVFSQKGRSRTGTRVHLVSDRGGTACLLRAPVDVSPLDEGVPVDPAEWCASCLRGETAYLHLELEILTHDLDRASADRWDAEAEVAVGAFILAYLDEHPPPDGARCADDLDRWGRSLESNGKRRLLDVGGDA